MWGMIAKMTAAPGKRDELIAVLGPGTRGMPGCLSFIISRDLQDENVVWVTEVWDSKASHDASFAIPAVAAVITQAKALVAEFSKVAEVGPVVGVE